MYLVLYKDVDIGSSAEKAVKDAVKKGEKGGKTVSVLEFKEQCKTFIVVVLKMSSDLSNDGHIHVSPNCETDQCLCFRYTDSTSLLNFQP